MKSTCCLIIDARDKPDGLINISTPRVQSIILRTYCLTMITDSLRSSGFCVISMNTFHSALHVFKVHVHTKLLTIPEDED